MKNIILILLNLLILSKPLNAIAGIDYTSGNAQISFDEWGQCILENERVSCIGDYAMDMPLFKKPLQISVGRGIACAIDDKRVKCWGKKSYSVVIRSYDPTLITNNAPALIDPAHVSVGFSFVCVIDEKKVKCWGEKDRWEYKDISGYSKVNVNNGTICASDEGAFTISCWSAYMQHARFSLYARNNFKTGFSGFCTYINDEVGCRMKKNNDVYSYNWSVNNLKYLGYIHGKFCVVDDEGKICREESLSEYNTTHRYFSIRLAIRTLPLNKKRFLEPLMKFDNYFCIKGMEVCVELLSTIISPLILTHESKYHQDELIPKFKQWKTSLDLIEIENNLENRKIAITAIQSSLEVSLSFLSGQQIDRTQDALRKVGQAMIDPMNDQNIIEAVMSVESLKEERAILLSSEKSKFLIECQQVAIDWLKLKVK